MAKTVIKFGLDSKSIRNAIAELKAYKNRLEEQTRELSESLARLGLNEAEIRFTAAAYDGVNDVELSIDETDNGYVIRARGEAVLFIEFGSGVHYNPTEPYPTDRPQNVAGIGEYGQKKGAHDAWVYPGDDAGTNGVLLEKKSGKSYVLTHGNPAAMPMWLASEEMRNSVLAIAREVFAK